MKQLLRVHGIEKRVNINTVIVRGVPQFVAEKLEQFNGRRQLHHEYFMQAAIKEVPQAQYETAMMLEKGLGCIQNFSEAAFWYEEAAKRGNIDAFNNLGAMFKEGRGVHQDYKKAFILFSKAAQAGNAKAQFNLGAMYDMGLGCEENKEKAIEWCRKAAYQGHQMAKDIIKRMQNDGQIVF